MTRRIVVGVTQNDAGRRALAWAARRAADRELPLLLVSVVGGALGVIGEGSVLAATTEDAEAFLAVEAERLTGTGLTVETSVRHGDPVAQLTQAAAKEELLVIGSDYRGEGKGATRGVHGIRIVSASSTPVVVVPELDDAERRGIVVGVDGSSVSAHAIAFAAAEADRLREPLIAVAIWTPIAISRAGVAYPEDYLRNMQGTTEETLALSLAGLRQDFPDLEIEQHAVRGYPSQIINEYAATARIAVVGSHGRGAIGRFLLGSISQEVLAHLATVTAVVR